MKTATFTERPILFSGEMVRAILDGEKHQSRRIVKPQPTAEVKLVEPGWLECDTSVFGFVGHNDVWKCPFGGPGDMLWVRETWATANSDNGPCICYRADKNRRYLVDESYPVDYSRYPNAGDPAWCWWASDLEVGIEGKWRPSIHMPRWASRICLRIEEIRVERVQDIGVDESELEGVTHWRCGHPDCFGPKGQGWHYDPRGAFMELWDSLYENSGFGWLVNPWVWVVTFEVCDVPDSN